MRRLRAAGPSTDASPPIGPQPPGAAPCRPMRTPPEALVGRGRRGKERWREREERGGACEGRRNGESEGEGQGGRGQGRYPLQSLQVDIDSRESEAGGEAVGAGGRRINGRREPTRVAISCAGVCRDVSRDGSGASPGHEGGHHRLRRRRRRLQVPPPPPPLSLSDARHHHRLPCGPYCLPSTLLRGRYFRPPVARPSPFRGPIPPSLLPPHAHGRMRARMHRHTDASACPR